MSLLGNHPDGLKESRDSETENLNMTGKGNEIGVFRMRDESFFVERDSLTKMAADEVLSDK